MTVYSALDYLGILTELPNNIRKRRINELLKQVNLEHEKNKRFKNLSGGMKRLLMSQRRDLTQKKDYAFTIFFLNWQWKELFYYLRI